MLTKDPVQAEIDRILMLLREYIRQSNHTHLQVQAKLGWGRSYISQLLTQQKSLRIDQMLLILDAIGVDKKELYRELLGQ